MKLPSEISQDFKSNKKCFKLANNPSAVSLMRNQHGLIPCISISTARKLRFFRMGIRVWKRTLKQPSLQALYFKAKEQQIFDILL